LISKTIKIINSDGIIVFIMKLATYLFYKLFSCEKLIVYEIDLNNYNENIKIQMDISYRVATESDIKNLNNFMYDYNKKTKRYSLERISVGDECVLAIYNDDVVGYIWIMKAQMELSAARLIDIPKEKAYIYRGYIREDYRGKRIFNGIDQYIFNKLKNENYQYVVTTVSMKNLSSIRTRERIGFKRIGTITQFRFLCMKYDKVSKEALNDIYKVNMS